MKELRDKSRQARIAIETDGYEGKPSLLRKGVNLACSFPFWKYVFKSSCEKLELNKHEFKFKNLPKEFDGFEILFLSDLHLEIEPNPVSTYLRMDLPEHDIVVLGGDFFDNHENFNENKLRQFVGKLDKPTYAVFGNHDKSDLIEILESLGVEILFNESVIFERNDSKILLTGIDDVTHYHTQYQEESVKNASEAFDGFKMVVSHNPNFLEKAESYGYDLQLSGHTHGGQFKIFNYIVFPQTRYEFAIANSWSHGDMQGYTSTGFGSSKYPIRNISPEAVVIKLSKI